MLRNPFRRKPAAVAAPRAPEGARLYVVGDIHGRLDLLRDLARLIAQDAAAQASAPARAETIFLGDYVDRGPDSAGVIDFLASGDFPTPLVALRGNHEAMLARFMEDETALEEWRRFGGLETLHSYGVNVTDALRGANYAQTRAALLERLPAAHRDFLHGMRSSLARGGYFFCHAGVRPGRALTAQTDSDLLWIREPFLSFAGDLGACVVHGHTPVAAPDVRANRINIDTGAYASGRLTALALEGDMRRFLVAGA